MTTRRTAVKACLALATFVAIVAFTPIHRTVPGPVAAACTAPAGETFQLVSTGKVSGGKATVQLIPEASPFGLAISADGRLEYKAHITVDGMPAPASFGAYTTFVIWLASPSLDQIRNLGSVGNGQSIDAKVDFTKMMYMISAEANDKGTRWAGPLLMVGRSSSARVQSLAGCDIYDNGGLGG